MDSGRVKEFCDYLRKKHRIDIKKDDIEDFFGSL
jgi:hypothetical protein